MKLGEFELIEKINSFIEKEKLYPKGIGIGDDCAVIKNLSDKKEILITTDILAEGVHFDLSYYSFYDIGYKSAIVNISDIICKGANPDVLFVSLSIPSYITSENILEWYKGFLEACKEYGATVGGGDTTKSKKYFFISITAIGSFDIEGIKNKNLKNKKVILRSGAKAGDNIYVLGRLGESDLGLKKLLKDKNFNKNDSSVIRHLRPKLFFKEWKSILKKYQINSSIDVSDGLLKDASHIARKSNVTINIFENSKWHFVNEEYKNKKDTKEIIKILKSILSGGEDYAFIFTTKEEIKEGENIIKVGTVISHNKKNQKSTVSLIDKDGKIVKTDFLGFTHF